MGFTCCSTFIEDENTFSLHIKCHSVGNILNPEFKCPLCSKLQSSKSNYRRHLILKHRNSVLNVFNLQDDLFSNNSFRLESHWSSNFEFDDHNENDDMEIEPSQIDTNDVPYFKDSESSLDSNLFDNYNEIFCSMLSGLKSKFGCAQNHLNDISSSVLKFVLNLFEKNILNSNLLNNLIKCAKSTYIQQENVKHLELIKHPDHNFYYTSLREVIQEYLKNPEICEQLYAEKISKLKFEQI